jgi:hypothetical protein
MQTHLIPNNLLLVQNNVVKLGFRSTPGTKNVFISSDKQTLTAQ